MLDRDLVYNIQVNFGDAEKSFLTEIWEKDGIANIQMFFGTVSIAKMLYVAGKWSLSILILKEDI